MWRTLSIVVGVAGCMGGSVVDLEPAGGLTQGCIDGECFAALQCVDDECVPAEGEAAGEGPSTPDASSATVGTSMGPGASSGTTGGPAGDSSTSTPVMDVGQSDACSIFEQDCPEGFKCAAYRSEGMEWDAVGCVLNTSPVDNPDGSCVSLNGYGLGPDSCDAGLICLPYGFAGSGRCHHYCVGPAHIPDCSSTLAACVRDGTLHVCMQACYPLDPYACTQANCYFYNGEFVCMPDTSGDAGGLGDACASPSDCDRSHGCIDGVCRTYCYLGTDCPGNTECLLLPDGSVEGLEEVGVCG